MKLNRSSSNHAHLAGYVSLLLAAALTACGGGDSDLDNANTASNTPTSSSTPAATRTAPATDAQGNFVEGETQRTLYVYARDESTPGQSQCMNECATKWPPMQALPDAKPSGDFAVMKRGDGSLQWTYKNKPLYYWHFDHQAGDTFGNGVEGQWSVARSTPSTPNKGQTAPMTTAGDLLTHSQSYQTLYTYNVDTQGGGKSQCYGNCAITWPPLLADKHAQAYADLGIIVRTDGSRQWTYQGQPLYTYAQDKEPGDTQGDGAGGHWYAAQIHLPQ